MARRKHRDHIGDMPLTKKALACAIKSHEGQIRRVSGNPYIVHPIEVYTIVRKYKESRNIDELCAAAVLHDVIEDTDVTYDDLHREFGWMVANLVQELTSEKEIARAMGKEAYLNLRLQNMSPYALVIKLADILSNVSENPSESSIKRFRGHYDFIMGGEMRERLNPPQAAILACIDRTLRELYDA